MTTPAGWYDDGSGRLRWWDGQQWTEHFAPETPAVPAQESPASESETTPGAPAAAVPDAQPAATAPDATAPEATASDATTPDATAADATAPDAAAPDATTPDATTPDATAAPAADAPEAVVAPEPASDWAAPASGAHELPGAAPVADWSAPGATAAGTVTPPPTGVQPPAGLAASPRGGYPGQYSPAAQAAGQGGYPGQAAYPTAQTYPAQGGGYPGAPAYAAAAPAPAKISVLGLVGLGLAALGLLLAFTPFTVVFSWLFLGAGFIVSLISLFLKGKKWPGITGLGVSVLGAIIAAIMSFVFFLGAVASQVDRSDSLPDDGSDTGTSDSGTDSGTDDGTGSGTVVEGSLGDPITVTQMSGSAELTITSATWGTTNGSDFEATNGGYLVIDLTWETLEGTTYVNPLYFSVETAEGAEGDYDIFGDATLESSELPAGETTQGTVSFDVAQSGSYVVIVSDELFQEVARVTVEATAR
ncbi:MULTISPECIES: DUF2510 domain-containing protein [Microbacterium]|uniref:DUF2510 domain-containing protein n=3 Tax=Microbacterium TaxID=33882 RepID=UPI002001358E|nr:DUF2510 domain-containing protein [Microbacterium sufflavum]